MAWDVAVEVLLPMPGVDRVQPSFRQSDRESLWVRYAEPLGDFPVIWHPEPDTQEVVELLAR